MQASIFLSMAAGLSLFLFGMNMMSENLERAAGNRLRRLLAILTKNRLVGVLVGTAFTCIIQSSSATTVMVVGLVNARLMDLAQATSVIMGANIGTTITGQLIALNLSDIAPIFMLVGVVMMLFFKRNAVVRLGGIIAGFGILFFGMSLMSSSMEPLSKMPEFTSVISTFSNPLLAMLVGLGITAIIQSSSASVGLIQAAAVSGLLPFETAMYLVLGTGIGTCVTAMISSIGTSLSARRAAVIHLMINVIGMSILLILVNIFPVADWIRALSGDNILLQIANANTMFKLFEVALLLPASSLLIKLVCIIVPGTEQTGEEQRLMYIDERLLSTPPIAVAQVSEEIGRMGRVAVDNLSRAMECFFEYDAEKLKDVARHEDVVDYLNHEITQFMISLGQTRMSANDTKLIISYYHVINDIERIGDHAENMAEYAQSRHDYANPFSDQSIAELREILANTIELCDLSLETLKTRDRKLLPRVLVMEERIDDLEEALQQAHVDRLAQGICTPRSGMAFTDMLSNLERVADHATNIAFSIEDDPEQEMKQELNKAH